MEELTLIENLEKHPYLKNYIDTTLIVSSGKYHMYENGPKVTKGKKKISLELLKDLIEKDDYYVYVKKLLNGEINRLTITKIVHGDLIGGFNYTLTNLSKLLEIAIVDYDLEIDDDKFYRCKEIFEKTCLDSFKETYKDKQYSCKIENDEFVLSVNEFIKFLELSEKDFDKVCLARSIKEVSGIKKEFFIYALNDFLEEENIRNRFDLPSNYLFRIYEINSYKKIDIESINYIPESYIPNIESALISNEIREEIFKDMPNDLSDLEKAIYIYIKMCKIFTYNEEFYAVDQKGEVAKRHEDISRISTLSLKNNSLVCYEFNVIYAKLLDELGIKCAVSNDSVNDYGGGHANLEFVVDKFIIFADSVTSVLAGDLGRVKTNRPLDGLSCINKNNYTKAEFEQILKKIYQLVMDEERVPRKETFQEILSEYEQTTNNIKDIPLEERIEILIKRVNSKNLQPIDNASYLLALSKILFSEYERMYYLKTPIIRFNENGVSKIAVILTITYNEDNIYYFYTPNNEMKVMSREEIENNFANQIFEYIDANDIKIPGINGGRL